MHSLEIYSIRIFDKLLSGSFDEKYCDLSNVRGLNLGELLDNILTAGSAYVDFKEMIAQQNPGRSLKSISP